jgi:hypothetical protein
VSRERYLQRRRDVQREQAKLPGLCEKALAEQRKCVGWAQIDESLELCLSPAAAKLARAQADTGDLQAGAALQRADVIDGALVDEVRAIRQTVREAPAPVGVEDPHLLRSIREALASRRERGESFDEAWRATAGRLVPDNGAAGVWRLALLGTRASWRSAYEGNGDQGGERVAGLLSGLDALDDWQETTAGTMAAA